MNKSYLVARVTKYIEIVAENARKRYIYNVKREQEKEEILINKLINIEVSRLVIESDASFLYFKEDNRLESKCSNLKLIRALEKLSDDEQKILELFILYKLKGKEVAEILNITSNNAYSKFERIKNKVKKIYMED